MQVPWGSAGLQLAFQKDGEEASPVAVAVELRIRMFSGAQGCL